MSFVHLKRLLEVCLPDEGSGLISSRLAKSAVSSVFLRAEEKSAMETPHQSESLTDVDLHVESVSYDGVKAETHVVMHWNYVKAKAKATRPRPRPDQ